MKQALLKKGTVIPTEVPEPEVQKGFVKIKVLHSCISAGTEVGGVIESKKSLLKKAIENPQKIASAFNYLIDKGLKSTKSKLSFVSDSFKELGYSISGEVIEIGEDAGEFKIGDIVAGAGQGFAVHAEYVCIPKNLIVKVPKGLNSFYASTGTIGSIALHGVRRANLKLGEFGVVFGVGLLGLLAVQLLKSSGVRVACIDLNDNHLDMAKQLGAELVVNSSKEDPVNAINNWSDGYGTDAVIFTAATYHNEPLSQSFNMCRKKGKVVLVGVSGMNIKRSDMYRNEIDLIISASYGPGRYDDKYELEGMDYPYAYVRWTENRNIKEYLRLIKEGLIDISKLNPKKYSIDKVTNAYQALENKKGNPILAIIEYNNKNLSVSEQNASSKIIINSGFSPKDKIKIGLIGAGGFASGTLLPIIYNLPKLFELKTVVDINGTKSYNTAQQFKAKISSSNTNDIFNDKDIDLVMVCTRHNNHAELVLQSLNAVKHVYVEKPLATTNEQLQKIKDFYKNKGTENKPMLMVGFNRRHSLYAKELKKHIENRQNPLFMHYRVNAGFIPYDVWIHKDGGRIVGEACHIIDLMLYLTGSFVKEVSVSSLNPGTSKFKSLDNKSMTLVFKDGSIGIIDYFSTGSKQYPKEFLEVHFDQKTIIIDDYKKMQGFGLKVKTLESKISSKGHKEEWLAVSEALKTGNWPISLNELIHTTEISLLASK